MFCRHEWELLNSFETESKVEQMIRLGKSLQYGWSSDYNKRYVTDYTCKKCGKLKRFVETNN